MRTCRFIAALLACALLLSGCWDAREMNHLALVMAVGIDKGDEEGQYRVTAQIARPGGLSPTGLGGGGAAGGTEPVFTAYADGESIFEAIRALARFSSRRIMWAHNLVVVVGEDLARDDISPVLDFFTRNPELRLRTWITVARDGTAQEVVSAKTGMESIPAISIANLFRYARLPGETAQVDVGQAFWAFLAHDVEAIMAAVGIKSLSLPMGSEVGEHGAADQVTLVGTAIFRERRLVGFVENGEARGLMWLRDKVENPVLSVPCPGSNGRQSMAIEIRSPEVAVRADVSGPVPRMTVMVQTTGWLNEQDCVVRGMDVEALKSFAEREFKAAIEADIRGALAMMQEQLGTDAILYGYRLRRQHPAWWRAHGERWSDIFPQVETDIHVSARIPKMATFVRPSTFRVP